MKPTRMCRHCGKESMDLTLYRKCNTKLGYANECKECINRINRELWKDPKSPRKKFQLATRYKCTPDEYTERMASSNCCEICGKINELCYDHCHTTMKFRGVICRSCNKAIGQLGDTADSVLKAYKYLERFEDEAK